MKGVVGMQMSQKKFIRLLERIGVICSVSEAEAIFKSHSKTRDGYLQYEEFRDLMRNFHPNFLDVPGNNQASGTTHGGFIEL